MAFTNVRLGIFVIDEQNLHCTFAVDPKPDDLDGDHTGNFEPVTNDELHYDATPFYANQEEDPAVQHLIWDSWEQVYDGSIWKFNKFLVIQSVNKWVHLKMINVSSWILIINIVLHFMVDKWIM